MDLPLIEAVKSSPCLYNKSTLTYRNKLRREVAWLEVASSVGANVETVQARWKALRDRYVKELTKLQKEKGKGSKSKGEIKWKYASKMSFLRLHLKTLPLSHKKGQSDNDWDEDEPVGIEDTTELMEAPEDEDSQDPLFSPAQQKRDCKSSHSTDTKKRQTMDSYSTPFVDSVSVSAQSQEEERVTELPSNEHEQHSTLDDLNEFMELTETEAEAIQSNSNPYINESPDTNTNDRITTLVDAVTHLVTNQVRKEKEKSRNTDFLQVLDTYLLRLPDNVQDDLKVEMLNLVFNKQKQLL